MRKGGWDGHSGLGGHKEGRLFPVKSVLKADREGFKAGLAETISIYPKIGFTKKGNTKKIVLRHVKLKKKKKYVYPKKGI